MKGSDDIALAIVYISKKVIERIILANGHIIEHGLPLERGK